MRKDNTTFRPTDKAFNLDFGKLIYNVKEDMRRF
jgi:hypothetical protein